MKKSVIRFKIDKLVRDHSKNFLKDVHVYSLERIMKDDEYIKRLKDKLVEEAMEVRDASNKKELLEEFSDVLEVFLAILAKLDLSMDMVEEKRKEKRSQKGGFSKKIYCDYVEMSSDNKCAEYYRADPLKYPEIKEENFLSHQEGVPM